MEKNFNSAPKIATLATMIVLAGCATNKSLEGAQKIPLTQSWLQKANEKGIDIRDLFETIQLYSGMGEVTGTVDETKEGDLSIRQGVVVDSKDTSKLVLPASTPLALIDTFTENGKMRLRVVAEKDGNLTNGKYLIYVQDSTGNFKFATKPDTTFQYGDKWYKMINNSPSILYFANKKVQAGKRQELKGRKVKPGNFDPKNKGYGGQHIQQRDRE